MKFFDTHAHYSDRVFSEGGEGSLRILLGDLFDSSVCGIINVGSNLDNSEICLKQSQGWNKMYAAVGIHPTECYDISDPDAYINKMRDLLSEPKCVAVGEIGLDYHYDDTDKIKQNEFLRLQMRLARESSKPVIFHDRDAHGDSLEAVKEFPDVRGVFHCYSGSSETAAELISLGWYISFTGVITYKNVRKLHDVVRSIPDDRIMLETDCPYLSPEPLRGKVNNSANLVYTANAMAEIRGTTLEHICEITTQNALRFFGVSD